ncbi:MAG: HAD family hydrolase [Gammaproteobacteria bacterium]|nr:HAD family hydrolase [Gammaproteobacteria bacterium]
MGATLIEGPACGPAKQLVRELRLPKEAKPLIDDFLFRTELESAGELAEFLSLHFSIPHEQAKGAATRLWEAQIKEGKSIPGACEAVARLRAAKIPTGIVSNIWRPYYEAFARAFPEEANKKPNFLSFRMGLRKPDPEIYRTALASVNEAPENTIMIGDTYSNDIAPAAEIGMKTIWILHRPQKEKKDIVRILNQEGPQPDLTLGHIEELQAAQVQALLY